MKEKVLFLCSMFAVIIIAIIAFRFQLHSFPESYDEAPITQLYDFPKPYNGTFTIAICKDAVYVKAEWFNGTCIIQSFNFAEVLENVTRMLSENGGGVVFIKSGIYIISHRHSIVRPFSDWVYFAGALIHKPRNIMIVGEGNRTVLMADADVTNPIYVYNAINFSISNLIVDGNKDFQNRPYLDCYALIFNDGGGENITYHDLLLRNSRYMGIYVGNNDFLSEVQPAEMAWYCPVHNAIIYNVITYNVGTGIFLDHVFKGLAYNVTSINDQTAIGFSSLSWEPTNQAFENITVIDPVGGAFAGWYPQGKLKNITIYLSKPQRWHLFDFTNASNIEIENIYIYGKLNPNKAIIYTNKDAKITMKGEIKINSP